MGVPIVTGIRICDANCPDNDLRNILPGLSRGGRSSVQAFGVDDHHAGWAVEVGIGTGTELSHSIHGNSARFEHSLQYVRSIGNLVNDEYELLFRHAAILPCLAIQPPTRGGE